MPKKGIARCIDNNEWRVTVILIAQGVFNLTLLKKTLSLGRFDTKSCLREEIFMVMVVTIEEILRGQNKIFLS